MESTGSERRAWADESLVGEVREGDEVVVNVEALDLGLGSGGFDVVHVNLTRGLEGPGRTGPHVMKLNYTSLQHPVEPVERRGGARRLAGEEDPGPRALPARPARPGGLGGRRAAARVCASATSRRRAAPCPARSRGTSPELRERELLCGHVTAGPRYGGEDEAISVAGALHAARTRSAGTR